MNSGASSENSGSRLRLAFRRSLLLTLAFGLALSGCAEFTPKFEQWLETAKKSFVKQNTLVIKDIKARSGKSKTVMTISANESFDYIAFRMREPNRVAIEIKGVKKVLPGPVIHVNNKLVSKINVLEFERSSVVRFEIGLKDEFKYDAVMRGSSLALTVSPDTSSATYKALRKLNTAQKVISKLGRRIVTLENKVEELEKKNVANKSNDADPKDKLTAKKAVESEAIDKVERKIADWLQSWQSGDVLRYSDHYATSFTHDDMSKEGWLDLKKRKFKFAGLIDVKIENIKVKVLNNRAVVRFTQIYKSESHSDIGNKTLVLTLNEHGWQIVSETWRPEL